MVIDVASGEVVQRLDYDEFGNVTTNTNQQLMSPAFAGGIYDETTGLVRFGARDYDPATGRWATKDPIRFGGGDTNLYGYVLGDPVNHTDSFGLAPGDEYSTPAAAAHDAITDIWSTSVSEGVEYGGYVYENPNGTYSYTPPRTDNKPDEVALNPGMCPTNTTPNSSYHTHGAPDANAGDFGKGGPEHFSPDDIKADQGDNGGDGVFGYLGTPSGEIVFHGSGDAEATIGNVND